MTKDEPTPPAEPLAAAVSGLADLREQLMELGRGQGSADDVKNALQEYLAAHGPSIRAVASAVGEELRRQLLVELHKWRASVTASTASRDPRAD